MSEIAHKLIEMQPTFKYLDQVEVLTDMLLNDGRRNPMVEGFQTTHEDVLIALELIKDRIILTQELVSADADYGNSNLNSTQ